MTLPKYKIINSRKLKLVQVSDLCLNGVRMLGFIDGGKYPSINELRKTIRRILLIRLAYIGDVVMTQPVTAPIRQAFPEASIDFLTSRTAAPLLENDPCIDKIIPFDAPWFYGKKASDNTRDLIGNITGTYDLGIDFRADLRNILHCLYRPRIRYRLSYTSGGGGAFLTHPVIWDSWKHKVEFHLDILRKAGLDAPSSDPEIYLTTEETIAAREMLNGLRGCEGKIPVVIHPGSRLELKRWPAERFVELARRMNKADIGPIILLESPGNDEVTREIAINADIAADLTGCLSIRQMAAVCHHAGVMICHDSAPMHIAAAVGCKVVALFGPSQSKETAPSGDGHIIIESSTCLMKTKCDENICIAGCHGCMDRISVEQVYEAVCNQLN
ncbi:glycosyltransferase family 9 protein [bacterium]|nr:glycosyltransferase family 9 protein [bacterium]